MRDDERCMICGKQAHWELNLASNNCESLGELFCREHKTELKKEIDNIIEKMTGRMQGGKQ